MKKVLSIIVLMLTIGILGLLITKHVHYCQLAEENHLQIRGCF